MILDLFMVWRLIGIRVSLIGTTKEPHHDGWRNITGSEGQT